MFRLPASISHFVLAVGCAATMGGCCCCGMGGGGPSTRVADDAPEPAPIAAPAPAPAPRPTESEAEVTAGYLYTIDGGKHPKGDYVALLSLLHRRFPDQSVEGLGDMATKAKQLCAENMGRRVDVITPLYALKNITDGYSGEEFDKMFANNPPPTLLALWVGTGCE